MVAGEGKSKGRPEFTGRERQTALERLKRCSASLLVRETQIKTALMAWGPLGGRSLAGTAQRWPRVRSRGLTPTTATPMPPRRAFGRHVSETAACPLTPPGPPGGPLAHWDPVRRPGPTPPSGARARAERGGGSRVCLGRFHEASSESAGPRAGHAGLGRVGQQRCRGLVWGGTRGTRGQRGASVTHCGPAEP